MSGWLVHSTSLVYQRHGEKRVSQRRGYTEADESMAARSGPEKNSG